MHLRHVWVAVETIGFVVTERCTVCSKTRTRVRPSKRLSAAHPYTDTRPGLEAAQNCSERHRDASGDFQCVQEQKDPGEEARIIDAQSPDWHG